MSRTALEIFKEEDPVGYRLMETACALSRSKNISPLERAGILLEIHDAVFPYTLKAAAESLRLSEEKPRYVWRNGARVKQ